jgi:hypothetical protein
MSRATSSGPLVRERMGSSLDELEMRAGDPPRQHVPDGHRAHGIGVAPQQERRRANLAEPVRETGPVVYEPRRHVRKGGLVLRPPVHGARTRDVDSAGGGDEHEPSTRSGCSMGLADLYSLSRRARRTS